MRNKRRINATSYHIAIHDLIEKLPKNKYKAVYGVPRGGLMVALYISHQLDIPIISNFLFDGVIEKESKYTIDEVLVVDDIIDTGKTVGKIKGYGFDVASIFYRFSCPVKPDYFVFEMETEWVVFPYERDDEEMNR